MQYSSLVSSKPPNAIYIAVSSDPNESSCGELLSEENLVKLNLTMQKTTYLSIGLTTVLVSALGYVSVMLGKGGWHHEDKGESFDYITEPISKSTDVTEPSKTLVEFTKTEFLTKQVVKVGDNIYVGIGWALANSIMIEGI